MHIEHLCKRVQVVVSYECVCSNVRTERKKDHVWEIIGLSACMGEFVVVYVAVAQTEMF
jgi:hypothetical protein